MAGKQRRAVKPPEGVSLRDYAGMRRAAGKPGGSLAAVQKAVRSGRITPLPGGGLDPAAADVEWDANTRATAGAGEQPAPPEGSAPSGAGVLSFSDARARKETALADLRELELRQKRGELVEATEVAAAQREKDQRVRERLLTLPDRISEQLAGMSEPSDIWQFLNEEIRDLLRGLSGELEQLAAGAE